MRRAAFLALLAGLLGTAASAADQRSGERPGGDTTRRIATSQAFALPAPNLTDRQRRDFFFGNRLFNTNWLAAPASTASFDGLGPLFNRVSCSGCHLRDGRGRPPEPGQPFESLLVRLSVPGRNAHGGPKPHPLYGEQLSDRALPGVPPEGRPRLDWREIPGRYADGTPYSLRAPTLVIDQPGYGAPGGNLLTSVRTAPMVFGLGLLEAVPERDLAAMADPEDRDGDGVRGRINRVWDAVNGRPAAGRFGWKANVPSLLHQNAAAAIGDIGITTALFPSENCEAGQAACRRARSGGRPEMSDSFLDRLTLYTRTLAVPESRPFGPAELEGHRLFAAAGCAACHRPVLTTGAAYIRALEYQTIRPFTDLLLHDMGEGLSDGRPDFEAGPRDWRTPPLWGLGLVETVNGHTLLLHDGRARGFAEAILWHGGEAEPAKERFRALSAAERAALIAYLRAL